MTIEQDIIKKLPYYGRVLLRCEGGRVTGVRTLRDNEHVASFNALIDLAKCAGYSIVRPDGKAL